MRDGKQRGKWIKVAAFGVFISALLGGGSTVRGAEERTYAERLGWPAGTKAVIFHVDDAGMSHDSNMLTSEWKRYRWGPVAGKPAVPGLVDEAGCLWHRVSDVVTHASADEVETEMRAQVDKALAMGIQPTHLDSHMGTCFQPFYIERYVKIGIEKDIPVMMIGGHMQHIAAEAAQFKPMLRSLAQKLWDAGLPVLDDLVTRPTNAKDYDKRKDELMALLRDMKPGVTQIIVHCTEPTEVFSYISGSGAARQAELRLMTDPDIKAFIENEGIVLTTWRELKQRRTKQ